MDNSATISAPAGAYQNIRITTGDCTSAEGVNVSLSDPDAPEAPVVSVAAAECGVAGSASISNFDADLTYNFTPAGPSVDAEGNISGLSAGTGYVVTSASEGCASEASAAFEIDEALEIADAPVVSVTAAECGVAGSASIDNFDEALTYTFAPTGPTVDSEGNISGLTAGTEYTVTSVEGDCSSEASVGFEIDEALEVPVAPIVSVTPADCGIEGSASIDNFDEALTYSFTPTGPSVDAEGNISGLTAGTEYTVTAGDGDCVSETSDSFEIEEALEIPDAPVVSVTAADCDAAGSASIDNFDEALTYTFAPTGPTVDSEGNISGLTAGTEYTVTSGEGDCTSEASAPFEIDDALEIPVIADISTNDPEVCGEEGTIFITTTGVEMGTYDIAYDGGVFEDVNILSDGSAQISAPAGTYNNIIIDNGECSSAEGMNAVITDPGAPEAPVADVVQPTCDEPFGSVVVENILEGVTYTLTGAGESQSNVEGVFVILIPGVYNLSVTIDDCTSEDLIIELVEPTGCGGGGDNPPNCSNFSPSIVGDCEAVVSASDFLTNWESAAYPITITVFNQWGGTLPDFPITLDDPNEEYTMDVSSYLGQTLEFSVTNDAGRCRLGVIEINGAPAPNLESAWSSDDPRANVGDGKILVYCGNVPSPDEHRPDVHMPCGGSYTGPVAMPDWVDVYKIGRASCR